MFAPSVGDRSKKVAALSAEEVAAKRADALRQNANANGRAGRRQRARSRVRGNPPLDETNAGASAALTSVSMRGDNVHKKKNGKIRKSNELTRTSSPYSTSVVEKLVVSPNKRARARSREKDGGSVLAGKRGLSREKGSRGSSRDGSSFHSSGASRIRTGAAITRPKTLVKKNKLEGAPLITSPYSPNSPTSRSSPKSAKGPAKEKVHRAANDPKAIEASKTAMARQLREDLKLKSAIYADIERIQKSLDRRLLAARVIHDGVERFILGRLALGFERLQWHTRMERKREDHARMMMQRLVGKWVAARAKQAIIKWTVFVRKSKKAARAKKVNAASKIQRFWRQQKCVQELMRRRLKDLKFRRQALRAAFALHQARAIPLAIQRLQEREHMLAVNISRDQQQKAEASARAAMMVEDSIAAEHRREFKLAAREIANMRRADRESRQWEDWILTERLEQIKVIDLKVARKTRDEMHIADKESKRENSIYQGILLAELKKHQAEAEAAKLAAEQEATAKADLEREKMMERAAARRRSTAVPPTPQDLRRSSSRQVLVANVQALRRRSTMLLDGDGPRNSAAGLGIEEKDLETLQSFAEKHATLRKDAESDSDDSNFQFDMDETSSDCENVNDAKMDVLDESRQKAKGKNARPSKFQAFNLTEPKVPKLGLEKLKRSKSSSALETTFDETLMNMKTRPESVRDHDFKPMWTPRTMFNYIDFSDSDSDSSSDFWPESIFRPASEFPLPDSESESSDIEAKGEDTEKSIHSAEDSGDEEEYAENIGDSDVESKEKDAVAGDREREACGSAINDSTLKEISDSDQNVGESEDANSQDEDCIDASLSARSETSRITQDSSECAGVVIRPLSDIGSNSGSLSARSEASAMNDDLSTEAYSKDLREDQDKSEEPDSPDIEVISEGGFTASPTDSERQDPEKEPGLFEQGSQEQNSSSECGHEASSISSHKNIPENQLESVQAKVADNHLISPALDEAISEQRSEQASSDVGAADHETGEAPPASTAQVDLDEMATKIQCAYRSAKARYALCLAKRQSRARLEDKCVIQIQKVMRSKLVRVQARKVQNAKLVKSVHDEYMSSYKNERLQRAWRAALVTANEQEKVDKMFYEEGIGENNRQLLKKEKETDRAESLHNAWQRVKPRPDWAALDGSDVYYYNPSLVKSEWEQPPGFVDREEEKRRADYWSAPPNPDELAAYQKAWVRIAGEDGRSVIFYNTLSGELSETMPMGFTEPVDVTSEDLAPQDIFVSGDNSESAANSTSDGPLAALVFCGLCDVAVADLRCEQCGPRFPYCVACFLKSHQNSSLRTHDVVHFRDADEDMPLEYEEPEKPEEEPINDINCSECQLVEATLICEQCGDQMCKPCFDKLHKISNRRKHTYSDYNGFLWEEYYDPKTDKCKYFQTETREYTDVCPVELMFGPERRAFLLRVAEEKRQALEQAKLTELKTRIAELTKYREDVIEEEKERRRMAESVSKATSKSRKIAKFIAPSLVKDHVPDPLDDDSINPGGKRLGTSRRSMGQRNTLSRKNANALSDANYLQKVMMGKSSKRANFD